MKYIGSKVLETDNLILRLTQEDDLKVLWQILLDENVSRYYLTSKINKKWEEEKKWQYKKLSHALDKDVFQWSIVLKSVDKCIKCVECGYSVAGFEKNEVVIKKNAILAV